MRLIDADVLKSYIDCGHIRPPTEMCFSELDVVRMLDRQPTIDAESVVRCKECVIRGFDSCPMCHDEYTWDEDDGGDYYTVDNTVDDGFCHMGAKMDGGAED